MSNLPDHLSSFATLEDADDASADALRAAIQHVIDFRLRQTYYLNNDGPVPGCDERRFVQILTELMPPDGSAMECRA
ncbi:MAG: hypothetical protein JWP29_1951 [Rhodoferax sp.]|nr:hypothetical protein [Rhodoferax sp.]